MKIASIDAFTKVDDSFLQRSTSGGWLSIFIFCIMGYLTFTEVLHYFTPHHHHEFIVDPAIKQAVEIKLDITVAMPCKYLTIDSFDTSGASQAIEKNFEKKPVKFSVGDAYLHGERLKKRDNEEFVHLLSELFPGAIQESEDPLDSDPSHSACRFQGSVKLNKVSGSVHITSSGHGFFGIHTPHNKVNFTHRIDKLRFGSAPPPHLPLPEPLSNSYELSLTHLEMYQYFISVVPTTYYVNNERVLDTYQYAVTDQKIVLATQEDYGVPGIFFRYSFEPLAVSIFEKYSETFLRFLVRLSGIIGGVYVCAGILHQLSSWAYSFWIRKVKSQRYYTPL